MCSIFRNISRSILCNTLNEYCTYSSTSHGPNSILGNQNTSKNTKNGVIGSDFPSTNSDVLSSIAENKHEGKSSSGKKTTFKHNPSLSQINQRSGSTSETPTTKAKSQWSEHTWSKYIYQIYEYV